MNAVWDTTLDALKATVGANNYANWIAPLEFANTDDGVNRPVSRILPDRHWMRGSRLIHSLLANPTSWPMRPRAVWPKVALSPLTRCFYMINVLYLSAEQFMYRFITALRDRKMMDFKQMFRSVDVLMVDDVQFMAGKDSTQEGGCLSRAIPIP